MTENQLLPLAFHNIAPTTFFLYDEKMTHIPVVQICFTPWRKVMPKDTYHRKPILVYKGKKYFAELLILEFFKENGWEGVWVDTYRRRYVSSYWPLKTESLLPKQKTFLEEIYRLKGNRSGCFDVFCWKQDLVVFAESKRKGHDHIRKSQKEWISAALKTGITESNLMIVEWTLTD